MNEHKGPTQNQGPQDSQEEDIVQYFSNILQNDNNQPFTTQEPTLTVSEPADQNMNPTSQQEKGNRHTETDRLLRPLISEPDRRWTLGEWLDRLGVQNQKERIRLERHIQRLASNGKGSGPVTRLEQGVYRYDPDKQGSPLERLIHNGRFGIHGFRFTKTSVVKIVRGGPLTGIPESNPTQPDINPKNGSDNKRQACDTKPTPKQRAGYP